MKQRPPQDGLRLPPEIIRAIEETISTGSQAKVRLVGNLIRVQAETVRLVKKRRSGRSDAPPDL